MQSATMFLQDLTKFHNQGMSSGYPGGCEGQGHQHSGMPQFPGLEHLNELEALQQLRMQEGRAANCNPDVSQLQYLREALFTAGRESMSPSASPQFSPHHFPSVGSLRNSFDSNPGSNRSYEFQRSHSFTSNYPRPPPRVLNTVASFPRAQFDVGNARLTSPDVLHALALHNHRHPGMLPTSVPNRSPPVGALHDNFGTFLPPASYAPHNTISLMNTRSTYHAHGPPRH